MSVTTRRRKTKTPEDCNKAKSSSITAIFEEKKALVNITHEEINVNL